MDDPTQVLLQFIFKPLKTIRKCSSPGGWQPSNEPQTSSLPVSHFKIGVVCKLSPAESSLLRASPRQPGFPDHLPRVPSKLRTLHADLQHPVRSKLYPHFTDVEIKAYRGVATHLRPGRRQDSNSGFFNCRLPAHMANSLEMLTVC